MVCGLRFCKVGYGISYYRSANSSVPVFPDSPAILEASMRYALDGVLLDGASGASPEVLLEVSLIQRIYKHSTRVMNSPRIFKYFASLVWMT